ncbi:GNAT family N-acetyltransferase [Winogradskyella echinorum]|uniref:GNAT family N-acetyltransferase n=1 Tax=Winogradskyella echinorum TaxID=538189 RepID=A0ABR6XXP3_9FLAO|nr:GNAT family N-acetyltransferase [Winogradskyella echinorum]MBC3845174.1 GNAT family N-acetyltransferase [Winogradskyella echinorum]MBC5749522.1 GNAT family N-acetyltransferase [Winogradskyella echinorum]
MYQITLLDKTSITQINQCLDLLDRSFGKGLDYYRWKHNVNGDYSIEEYTFCIFKDDLCIATTQVIINEMFILKKPYRFGILCDGATHKDYRRLGLFEKLLSHINTFCSQKDVTFVYSTGNAKSRNALLKLGFEDFFSSYKATKRVRYTHTAMKGYNFLLTVFGKLVVKQNNDIREVSIEEYSTFFAAQKNKFDITCEKSQEYLKWRLDETTGTYSVFGSFDKNKKLQAVLVLKKSKNGFYIVDAIYKENMLYLNQLLKYTYSLAMLNKNIIKINSIHNNFKGIKKVFQNNNYKITKSDSSTLLYVLNSDFKIPYNQLENMHYMRIDKNE